MPTTGADGSRPPLLDLLHTVPSPLIVVLVGLAPSITRLRRVLDILTWRSSWQDSVLALALCWAVCLFSEFTLRYLLPLVACAALVARTRTTVHDAAVPATEDTLNQAINDLSGIYFQLSSLRPPSSIIPITGSLSPIPLLRLLTSIYIPYLLLTQFVRLRVLLAIAGTVFLTWRSRWAAIIRRSLVRSAYLRLLAYRIYTLLTGLRSPISSLSTPSAFGTTSAQSVPSKQSTVKEDENAIALRFLFTLYENQRWWVGLDFTAALLPGERPSWSTAPPALLPAAPPAAFTLPPPTAVYLPDPKSADGKGRIKRTARWRWEEGEWRVIVRTPITSLGADKEKGAVKTERVERPIPILLEEGVTPASTAGRILSKMRQASLSANASITAFKENSPERHNRSQSQSSTSRQGPHEKSDHESSGGEHASEDEGSNANEDDPDVQEDPCTDADGWAYGDNKWECLSERGGMGKYTRYRRWTRVAVLYESVEHVGPGFLGVVRGASDSDAPSNPSTAAHSASASQANTQKDVRADLGALHVEPFSTTSGPTGPVTSPVSVVSPSVEGPGDHSHARTGSMDDDRNRLRQRLRAAVQSASAH